MPVAPHLRFAIAQPSNVWSATSGAVATIDVVDRDGTTEVFRRELSADQNPGDRTWSDIDVDLTQFSGRTVWLQFAAAAPPGGNRGSWVIWRNPSVSEADP
jgi:hypothetical protein